MLEHSSLADNISNAFRFDNYSKGLLVGHLSYSHSAASTVERSVDVFLLRTFIFTDILERKCQVGVFALDNADLAKGASADNS